MAIERGQIIIEDDVLAKGFVQIPIAFLQLPDLGAGAKLAYGILLWYGWKGRGYPGHEEAAAAFGIGESSLRRYLTQLEERGLIETIQAGLGQTNSYKLPPLKLSVQGVQSERSGRSNQADNDVNTSVNTLKTDTGGDPSPSSINLNDRKTAIDHIHSAWAPGESRSSIAGQFQRFPTEFIWQAIELTTAALDNGQQIETPAAYCYGVAENILHRDQDKPLAHQHLPAPVPISQQDREAALAELDRIREKLSG